MPSTRGKYKNFMEKRFITFIVISFLILISWQFLLNRFYPEAITPSKDLPKVEQAQNSTPNPTTTPLSTTTPAANLTPNPTVDPNNPTATPPPVVAVVAPKKVTVKTSIWNAVFDNKGAVLSSLTIHHFHKKELKGSDLQPLELISQEGIQKVGAPLRLEADNAALTKILNESFYSIDSENDIDLKDGETKELTFTLKDASGVSVEKHLKITGGKYLFDLQVKALNNTNQPLSTKLVLGPNFGDQSVKKFDYYSHTPPQMLVNQNGKTTFLGGAELEHRGAAPDATKAYISDIDWVATIDHYFTMAVIPPSKLPAATVHNNFFQDNGTYKHLLSLSFPIANDQTYLVFIGPKDRDLLAETSVALNNKHDLETMINYGFFAFIVRPTIPVLDLVIKVVHNSTNNYGWAIIAIAFLTNIIFFPLKWKSSIAMEKAKKFQPRQKEIQEKLKTLKPDDPRAIQLQSEMLTIFKESNPFLGCLPVLLSFPILWAMYIYLLMSLDVRQSPFIFWVKDLSIADPTYILPIIMTVASTAATLIMPNPAPMDDPSQKMQKFMFTYIMPVVFLVFFFINAPSGLVLYWMFNSVFGVAVQLIINKLAPKPVATT